MSKQGLGTRAIHAGQSPDPSTGAVMTPIYATSTYVQSSPGVHQGFEYSRSHNPTRFAWERCIADLEGGTRGYAFASGLAATSTVLDMLDAGSHVVCMDDVYGGTYRLFERVRRRSAGLDFSFVNLNDFDALAAAIRPDTKLIWAETPTNPMLKIVDLTRLGEFARSRGIILVVDNTFCSPMVQRPLEHGAHMVMHSATKYLNGHSDAIAGALVTAARDEAWQRLRTQRHDGGAVLAPFEAFLVHRGMRTLAVRVRRQSASALAIASALAGHPGLEEVLYPGLPTHPQHAVAARQFTGGFGGMLSLRVRGGAEAALAVAGRLRAFARATSLGGVESLVEHRATVEPPDSPVPRELLRLSIGLEDPADLIDDLRAALG